MNWKLGLTGSALLAAAATALGFFWPFGARTQILRLPGVVEIQEIRLGSKIGGRVEKVEVVEGAIAEAGAPLVAFAMPEMEAQREQLQARVLSAAADLEKARNGARPEEKEAARQALATARAHLQLLKAGARSEEIREARSQFESAEADLRLAREEYERAERLLHQQSSSRAEFDTARASRERALGQSARTKAHLDMLLAGNRPEEILKADADMRKAQANYDLLLAGSRSEDIAAAEARLAEVRGKLHEIEANLLEAVVRAPERVLIEVLAVRKGDLVSPNQPILRSSACCGSLGEGLRPRNGPGQGAPEPGGGCHGRCLSGPAFQGFGHADRLDQRVHAAQRPERRRASPPSLRHQGTRRRSPGRLQIRHGRGGRARSGTVGSCLAACALAKY